MRGVTTHSARIQQHDAGDRFSHGKQTRPCRIQSSRDAHLFSAATYDDRVTAGPVRPVVLRNGASIEDPLRVVLGLLQAYGRVISATRRGRRRSASRTSGWRTGAAPASQRPRSRRSSSGPHDRANPADDPARRLAGRSGDLRALAAAAAALRRVRRHPGRRVRQDDQGAAPKAPGADLDARQHCPEVPDRRRPRSPDPVRSARPGLPAAANAT